MLAGGLLAATAENENMGEVSRPLSLASSLLGEDKPENVNAAGFVASAQQTTCRTQRIAASAW